MAPRFVFNAADVDAAGLAVELDLASDWLAAELAEAELRPGEGPSRFRGRLSRSGAHDVVVRGKLTAQVSAPCARCLEPAPVSVDTELSLLLRPARSAPPRDRRSSHDAAKPAKKPRKHDDEGEELLDEDASADTYDGESIVLDGFLREAILLELPIFPLCSDTCAGIRIAPNAGARGSDANGGRSGVNAHTGAARGSGGRNGPALGGVDADGADPGGELDPRLAPLAALRDRLAGKPAAAARSSGPPGARERAAKLRLPTSGLRPKKKR